jgi:hypothetical protein
VTVDAGPPDPSASPDAELAFSSDDPAAAFACSLDGADAVPCTSPVAYVGLPYGPHFFSVRATDAAGNAGPAAEWRWTIEPVG